MKLMKHQGLKVKPRRSVSKGFKPFWPMRRIETMLDRLFEDPVGGRFGMDEPLGGAWVPPVNIYEEKNNFIVKAELPGMKKEEFHVYLTGISLNIDGERKNEAREATAHRYRSERYYGHFHRSIPLPAPVDEKRINAHYQDGILTVICPRTAVKRKEVQVTVN